MVYISNKRRLRCKSYVHTTPTKSLYVNNNSVHFIVAGPSERINVKVTVNNPPNSSHPQTASTVDVSNVSPSSGGPQTLADLKKQRSMNRVAQQSSPQAPTRDNSHGSERGQASMSAAAASASSRPSASHHKQGSSMRNKSNGGERGLEDQQRPHHSKRNNSGNKNGRSRGQGGHRGSNNSNASSANVKKFTHSEVVGPPPKKTGCCRVM